MGGGGTVWAEPSVPTDEQIGTAVSDWLDDHPDATTTVEDGSITMAKLAQDVQDAIDSAANSQDALVLASGIAIAGNADGKGTDPAKEHLDFYDLWEPKFNECAAYIKGNDSLMFTFFTDPHTMPSETYNIRPEDALLRLREVRWIYENTPSQFVLCGGDWITDSYTLQEAMRICARVPNMMRTEIGERAYTIVGNHDINSQNTAATLTEAQLARIWYDKDVGYYTLSGDRWTLYAFDSGHMTSPMSAYRWGQVDWFAQSLLGNTKPHLLGAIHVWAVDNIPTGLVENLTSVANAFNQRDTITVNGHTYDFSQATGTFHFIVSGHFHNDFYMNNNNIPCFGTAATHRGLCTDVCCVDFDNAIIHMTRFGFGDSRDFEIIPNGGYTTMII